MVCLSRNRWSWSVAGWLLALGSLAGCHRSRAEQQYVALETDPGSANESDAPGAIVEVPKAPQVRRVYALNFQTSVLSEMEWPPDTEEVERRKGHHGKRRRTSAAKEATSDSSSRRIGYLRFGASTEVLDAPVVNDACPEGWYTLKTGGYTCGKGITFEEKNPRVTYAPKPPREDDALPYAYGTVTVDRTPLYKRILSPQERAAIEAAPVRPSSPVASAPVEDDSKRKAESPGDEDGSATPPSVQKVRLTLKELRGRGPVVRKLARGFILALDKEFRASDSRWWRTTAGFAIEAGKVMPIRSVAEPHGRVLWEPAMAVLSSPDGHTDGGVKHSESAPEMPLAAIEDTGVSMDASGLATDGASLDASDVQNASLKDVLSDAGRGAFARVSEPAESTDGLVGFLRHSPVASFRPVKEGGKLTWAPPVDGLSVVAFARGQQQMGGVAIRETTEGFWLRTSDVIMPTPMPPEDLAPGEKWVDVDLAQQTLVAYEGMRPVFAARTSTGRKNLVDKERDYQTPAGTFRIREKHITATMDGDVASDGPYSIEDVPWVMYFNASIALHGAFWHNQFGTPRSHGCVNLAPADAKQLFAWVEPRLPPGLHGVYATATQPGTRVVVHGHTR